MTSVTEQGPETEAASPLSWRVPTSKRSVLPSREHNKHRMVAENARDSHNYHTHAEPANRSQSAHCESTWLHRQNCEELPTERDQSDSVPACIPDTHIQGAQQVNSFQEASTGAPYKEVPRNSKIVGGRLRRDETAPTEERLTQTLAACKQNSRGTISSAEQMHLDAAPIGRQAKSRNVRERKGPIEKARRREGRLTKGGRKEASRQRGVDEDDKEALFAPDFRDTTIVAKGKPKSRRGEPRHGTFYLPPQFIPPAAGLSAKGVLLEGGAGLLQLLIALTPEEIEADLIKISGRKHPRRSATACRKYTNGEWQTKSGK
eukprot:TRINITY_DN10444_c0_g3_i1.p1 TRINITY_DN10444_c0_g3~~TRINITY_DN10444_c0_g3_i1.p1  ORF type:complete len:318 (-),score=34.59 TRINITY_DN10444_c0_g3_i1:25-978(-)